MSRPAQAGFTFMEVLMVVGILSVLAAVVLFMDVNSYRGDAFRAEVNALGVALQTSRANALNNVHEERHGVAIRPGGYDGYVIFEGTSYAARNTNLDVPIKAQYGVTFSPGTPTEVLFCQLSGDAVTPGDPQCENPTHYFDGDITITDLQRGVSAAISLDHEGKISW